MSLLRPFIASHVATRDARRGVHAKSARLDVLLGPSPEETSRQGQEYNAALHAAADTSRRDELRADLERLEEIRARVGPAGGLTAALVVVWGVEFAGALLLLKTVGLPASSRILPALALTIALIALTHATVNATRSGGDVVRETTSTRDAADLAAEAPALPRFRARTFLLPLVYGVLVVAITAARVVGSDADGPLFLRLAEAVLVLAITVGPAAVATFIEEKRRPAVELARRIAIVRRRLRHEERVIARAEAHLRAVDRASTRWLTDQRRAAAAYATSFELARAEAAGAPAGDALDAAPLAAQRTPSGSANGEGSR